MNNLAKLIIRTGYKNNRDLLLRLCRNADCVRNVNYLSRKTLDKMIQIRKEKFDLINIRTYASQLSNENIQLLEQNTFPDKKKSVHISENDYARKFFLNSTHYTKTILLPNKFKVVVTNEEALKILDTDWSMANPYELVLAFRKLSYNIMNNDTSRISDTRYSSIFNTLHEKIPNFNDNMLEEILKCLIPFREHSVVSLEQTINLLDRQCELRYKRWSIDKMLLMSDIFCCLRSYKNSNFIWKLMRKMNSKLNKLTPKNLVQLLYLVNISRRSELNMYEVEVRLEECIDELSIHELGIVAMGYFKSRSKIRNSLFLRAIINRVICELEKIDSISLAALIKLIRYSMQFNEVVHFRMLLNNIIPIVPRLDSMCLTHIAHASAKAALYEKPLIDAIIERMYNEIKDARIKDIERLTFMLSTFDIDVEHPIYDKIINEVTERVNSDKMTDVVKFPNALPTLVQYLMIKDIYPLHLLKVIMNPSYLKLIHKGNVRLLHHNYSVIQHSIKIERPEYAGPLLEEGLLRTLTKLHWKQDDDNLPSTITRMFNEVIYVFKEIIANDVDLYVGKVLPNFLQNDIVIGIDENENFISTQPILSKLCDFNPKRVNDTFPKNVKWIVLVLLHFNHKIKGTKEPTGRLKAKLRQLKRIGYKPILIVDDDWLRCKDLQERGNYLKDLIKNV